ncbi:MAG TPA: peptidylprolyl isomerase [Halothiobacillus sp.]|nr:peptidylprolyl isomerase [Halothiobacillus sp.]
MLIEQNTVVRMRYVLTDDDGAVIDDTAERGFEYIHGHGNLIPVLEAALAGKAEGDRLELTIEPEDAYGLHDESAVLTVPRSRFAPEVVLVEGNMVETLGPEGRIEMLILKIDGDDVLVDLNHPLAGLRLHFAIDVGPVRMGHADEIKHGRVHPGGHHLMVGDSTYMGDWQETDGTHGNEADGGSD